MYAKYISFPHRTFQNLFVQADSPTLDGSIRKGLNYIHYFCLFFQQSIVIDDSIINIHIILQVNLDFINLSNIC